MSIKEIGSTSVLPKFSFSDYLDSETLVELPTLELVVLLPQAVAIAATIATTATKAKIFFIVLFSLQ